MIRPTGIPDKTTATRSRRNDRGLTTLEWLLIVAAVAGLAALAVVLVQNVVDDTAEQIAGSSARLTAAEVAAAEITDEVSRINAISPAPPDKADQISDQKAKCERLKITYGDAFTEGSRNAEWDDSTAGSEKCEIK